ncbi:MAG TPA: DUF4157 domain-containing protein [Candidatus Tectomicrobia bacterium]
MQRQAPIGQHLLQRKEGQCTCGGGCPRCLNHAVLQPKLAISVPGDPFELEADRVAEQVMRMPAPALQRTCGSCAAGGSTCPKCEAEKSGLVQRKPERASDSSVSICDSFLHNLGPGQPLDPATRAFLEPRFGHDFSRVRVHTDAKAAESAQAVNALAYTVGRNIVFGEGQYLPGTTPGKGLIAHELTHVAQQRGDAIQLEPQIGLPGNLSEQEADRVADSIAWKAAPNRGSFSAEVSSGQALPTDRLPALVRQGAISAVVQRQGVHKPKAPPSPVHSGPPPASTANRELQMPVVLHYVSKTRPEVMIGEIDECGGKLWDSTSVNSVNTGADTILKAGFGIKLAPELDDLGCISDAYVVEELDSLKPWIANEVVKKGGRALDANKTHIFFIDGFYKGGARSHTVGEVVDIGGNLGGIIKAGNPGRTMAHELGHTLGLHHPKDYGLAIQMDPDFETCAEGTYLMEWGGGTCVSRWERSEARKYGSGKGRLK